MLADKTIYKRLGTDIPSSGVEMIEKIRRGANNLPIGYEKVKAEVFKFEIGNKWYSIAVEKEYLKNYPVLFAIDGDAKKGYDLELTLPPKEILDKAGNKLSQTIISQNMLGDVFKFDDKEGITDDKLGRYLLRIEGLLNIPSSTINFYTLNRFARVHQIPYMNIEGSGELSILADTKSPFVLDSNAKENKDNYIIDTRISQKYDNFSSDYDEYDIKTIKIYDNDPNTEFFNKLYPDIKKNNSYKGIKNTKLLLKTTNVFQTHIPNILNPDKEHVRPNRDSSNMNDKTTILSCEIKIAPHDDIKDEKLVLSGFIMPLVHYKCIEFNKTPGLLTSHIVINSTKANTHNIGGKIAISHGNYSDLTKSNYEIMRNLFKYNEYRNKFGSHYFINTKDVPINTNIELFVKDTINFLKINTLTASPTIIAADTPIISCGDVANDGKYMFKDALIDIGNKPLSSLQAPKDFAYLHSFNEKIEKTVPLYKPSKLDSFICEGYKITSNNEIITMQAEKQDWYNTTDIKGNMCKKVINKAIRGAIFDNLCMLEGSSELSFGVDAKNNVFINTNPDEEHRVSIGNTSTFNTNFVSYSCDINVSDSRVVNSEISILNNNEKKDIDVKIFESLVQNSSITSAKTTQITKSALKDAGVVAITDDVNITNSSVTRHSVSHSLNNEVIDCSDSDSKIPMLKEAFLDRKNEEFVDMY